MGADLVLGWVPSFEFTEERCEILHKKIEELTVPELVGYVSELHPVYFHDQGESGNLHAGAVEETIELLGGEGLEVSEENFVRLVKEDMKSTVEEDLDLGTYRDVVEFQYGDASYAVFVSGGMTWGDDPVNETLNRLQCMPLQLYDLFVDWAKHDWAERVRRYESAAAKTEP